MTVSGCQLPPTVCVKAQSTLSGESPAATLCVLVNILWVVVRDELVTYGLTENQPGDPGENSTNPKDYSYFGAHCAHNDMSCHFLRLDRPRVAYGSISIKSVQAFAAGASRTATPHRYYAERFDFAQDSSVEASLGASEFHIVSWLNDLEIDFRSDLRQTWLRQRHAVRSWVFISANCPGCASSGNETRIASNSVTLRLSVGSIRASS